MATKTQANGNGMDSFSRNGNADLSKAQREVLDIQQEIAGTNEEVREIIGQNERRLPEILKNLPAILGRKDFRVTYEEEVNISEIPVLVDFWVPDVNLAWLLCQWWRN